MYGYTHTREGGRSRFFVPIEFDVTIFDRERASGG